MTGHQPMGGRSAWHAGDECRHQPRGELRPHSRRACEQAQARTGTTVAAEAPVKIRETVSWSEGDGARQI